MVSAIGNLPTTLRSVISTGAERSAVKRPRICPRPSHLASHAFAAPYNTPAIEAPQSAPCVTTSAPLSSR